MASVLSIASDSLGISQDSMQDDQPANCGCHGVPGVVGAGRELSPEELRRRILDIQNNPSVPDSQKPLLIQQLMTAKWSAKNQAAAQAELGQEAKSGPRVATYHTLEDGTQVLGCKHYQRGCKILAPCCGQWFGCRLCHDDVCDHPINRFDIREMMCMLCFMIQPTAQQCCNTSCAASMSRYFCDICQFFDNAEKDIYHCPKCNICRIGKGLDIDYFHCDKCNACMHVSLREHKCVERSLESNCPICSDFMFTSTTPVMFLNCGHCMHVQCYEQYIKTNYTCPMCSKSLGDMSAYFRRLDEWLALETMPPEFVHQKSSILCSDCEQKSVVPFHFHYHKCAPCGSYNTKVIATIMEEDPKPSGSSDGAPVEADMPTVTSDIEVGLQSMMMS